MKRLTQKIRFAIQLIFLILMPSLFALAFSQIKQSYVAIIGGNFDFMQMVRFSSEMLIIIVSTILFGRFFCGFICAFGFINDIIYWISLRIFKIKP